MILRFKVWKDWYKKCMNGRGYKFLVLFGLRHSPTFNQLYEFEKYKKIKIQFSLTGFVRCIKLPFNIDTPEFQQCIIGKKIYLEHYTEVGKITGIDVAEDLIFAEVPNKKYQSHVIDAKGYNKCLFEVVKL